MAKSSEERVKLEAQIEDLQKQLTEEATAKKQITLLLLEDRKKMATLYLEEKKRSEDLNHLLREEKSKVSIKKVCISKVEAQGDILANILYDTF